MAEIDDHVIFFFPNASRAHSQKNMKSYSKKSSASSNSKPKSAPKPATGKPKLPSATTSANRQSTKLHSTRHPPVQSSQSHQAKSDGKTQYPNQSLVVSLTQANDRPAVTSKVGKAEIKTSNKQQIQAVFLGLPDGSIAKEDFTDAYVTKIGSTPDWFIPGNPPPFSTSICGCCGKPMFLLLQAYAPLEGSAYHRIIYVWGCNRRACMRHQGSFRALRAHYFDEVYAKQQYQFKEKSLQKQQELINPSFSPSPPSSSVSALRLGDIWTDSFTPTNMDGLVLDKSPKTEKIMVEDKQEKSKTDDYYSYSDQELPRELEMRLLLGNDGVSERTQVQEWPAASELPSFPGQYLYITEEILEESLGRIGIDISKYQKLIDLQQCEVDECEEGEGGGTWTGEAYEKQQLPKGMDKALRRFMERAAEWPTQCVRYDFKGTPLFYSNLDLTAKLLFDFSVASNSDSKHGAYTSSRLPSCPRCGASRVFELQLMPNVLSLLAVTHYVDEEDDIMARERMGISRWEVGMDWGTVMVFVCENDCNPSLHSNSKDVHYFEEVCMVQYEID